MFCHTHTHTDIQRAKNFTQLFAQQNPKFRIEGEFNRSLHKAICRQLFKYCNRNQFTKNKVTGRTDTAGLGWGQWDENLHGKSKLNIVTVK